MPDHTPGFLPEEKHRLRQEARELIRILVDSDTIEDGAKLMLDYRTKFGQSDDYFLRYGLAALFLGDLTNKCFPHQAKRVGCLIDECSDSCVSFDMRPLLRMQELAMHRRCNNAEGEAKCIRILTALNQR